MEGHLLNSELREWRKTDIAHSRVHDRVHEFKLIELT